MQVWNESMLYFIIFWNYNLLDISNVFVKYMSNVIPVTIMKMDFDYIFIKELACTILFHDNKFVDL